MSANQQQKSIGLRIVSVFAVIGVILILYRFIMGIGAVTNLSGGYPWGLWIGFDVLAGIALASGGFVVAGVVHLFGGRKFHPLVRPAIMTALLGYLMFILGLMVDLGRWWNLWRAMINWQHASPMFEVAWCVTLYTVTLMLEFVPIVFERYKLEKLHTLWKTWAPFIVIGMLTLFILAMTYSFVWALILLSVLLLWEVLMRRGIMPRDHQMPILMIMAGVMFSTMHQSSLGALFLAIPHKLHVLWFTPSLPLMFLYSAILAGPAMIIFESFMSERVLKHEASFDLLQSLSKSMPYLLGGYLAFKIADIVARGVTLEALAVNTQAVSWWGEITVGIMIPLVLFLSPAIRQSKSGLLWSSVLVIIGVIWNRINVAVIGMMVQDWEVYYPLWTEFLISIGIVSIGLIAFRWIVTNMPVYEHEPAGSQ
jgi:formate dehydrogenase iron-sulfur subunit